MNSILKNKKKHNKKHPKNKRRYSQVIKTARKKIKKQLQKDFFLLSKNDIDKKCLNVPSLKSTDTLFNEQENIDFSNQLENDEIYFQNGYASAAALMLNLIKIMGNKYISESYINPAMFCFRQYLELSMKDSLLRYRNMRKEGTKSEPNINGHDLVKLWEGLKKYLPDSDEETNSIGNLIKEFQNADKGTAFRYNRYLSHKGENYERSVKIDIEKLYTRMLQMYRFFEGINEDARLSQDNNT